MKRLLIIVGKKVEEESTYTHLKQDLKGKVDVVYASFKEVSFSFEKGKVDVRIGDYNIRDFDLVYFRKTFGHSSIAKALSICMDYYHIRFIDPVFGYANYTGDKLPSLIRLAINDLPVIPTFFCWRGDIEKNIDYIIEKFKLPVVAKNPKTQRGKGLFLLKDRNDFISLRKLNPNNGFMFQKYCERETEYRLLVLKDRIAVAEKKIQKDVNEFRANVARGASEEFFDPKLVSTEIRNTALKASKLLKLEIAGVDILIDKEGKSWLLEVNRGPGFTYDEISPELPELAKYFEKEIS